MHAVLLHWNINVNCSVFISVFLCIFGCLFSLASASYRLAVTLHALGTSFLLHLYIYITLYSIIIIICCCKCIAMAMKMMMVVVVVHCLFYSAWPPLIWRLIRIHIIVCKQLLEQKHLIMLLGRKRVNSIHVKMLLAGVEEETPFSYFGDDSSAKWWFCDAYNQEEMVKKMHAQTQERIKTVQILQKIHRFC